MEVSGLMIRGGLGYAYWVTTFKIQFGDDASELKYIEDLNGVEVNHNFLFNFKMILVSFLMRDNKPRK